MKKFTLKMHLVEDLLGSAPNNKDIYSDFIVRKAEKLANYDELKNEELDTLVEKEDKQCTVFHRDEKGLFLYNYHIKGAIKDFAESLRKSLSSGKITSRGSKWSTIRGKVDDYIRVSPRRIYLNRESDGILERPLTAQTLQGKRTALAKSEYIKAPVDFECTISLFDCVAFKVEMLEELLKYGEAFKGIGQWRNADYGMFTHELIEKK